MRLKGGSKQTITYLSTCEGGSQGSLWATDMSFQMEDEQWKKSMLRIGTGSEYRFQISQMGATKWWYRLSAFGYMVECSGNSRLLSWLGLLLLWWNTMIKATWRGKVLFALHFYITVHHWRKSRTGKGRNLEAGSDTKAMEGFCSLVFPSWLVQRYRTQEYQPKDGTTMDWALPH